MKLIYVFLGIFCLNTVCMDKPLSPRVKPAAASKVKAAASAWPPTQAASVVRKPEGANFFAKKSAARLKRSSDEEIEGQPYQRPRRRSIDTSDPIMSGSPKLVRKPAAQTLADQVKTEVQKGQLKIISANPPICVVVLDSVKWQCRYCDCQFNNKEIERLHIRDSHRIIPAEPEQEWGISWEEIKKMKDYIHHLSRSTPPLPEDQNEEEQVEEIL